MATQLADGGRNQAQSVASILESKGRTLHSGFFDGIDAEAERHGNAINRARGLAPRKLGKRKAGFGSSAHSPNRGAWTDTTRYASLSR